jgi:hypothetical protein
MVTPTTSKTPQRGRPKASRAVGTQAALEADRRPRRERKLRLGLAIAVLLAGGGLVVWAWQARDATPTKAQASSAAAQLAAVSGLGAPLAPPWPAPADAPVRATLAGLQLGSMGTAEHYHVHLDILLNGQALPVPANIGVDQTSGAMSYLHTHTPDGVVHIEAGRAGQPFTLGQLFTEWNVRLSATQVGSLQAGNGNTLVVYVNGAKVPGNPAQLRLAAHQEIAVVYGPPDQTVEVPSTYAFVAGD